MKSSIPKKCLHIYANQFSNLELYEEIVHSASAVQIISAQLGNDNLAKKHIVDTQDELNYEFDPLLSDEHFTRVIISLTPDHAQLRTINGHIQYLKIDIRSLLICSTDRRVEFTLAPNQNVRFLEIILNNNWMKKEAEKVFPSTLVENSYQLLRDAVFWENCNSSLWESINSIVDEMRKIKEREIIIDNDLCAVLAQSIFRRIIQESSPIFPGSEVHLDKLMRVKDVLLNHLNMSLPNLSQIAYQVALSESTLKRHFKNVFGKSVYEYYLEKKMEHAKQLLKDEPITINEIAERLGYEKVSNFIEIFKKRYGMSPGHIKKKYISKRAGLQ